MASTHTPLILSEDYERIAQAIAFMRQHHLEQPDLATVARQVQLSESHFQRLFTKWAGLSPKRFLQYLTVEYAKAQMAQTRNLLDLSLEAGLSSPGRLHDLFVSLEAMSPGEFKAGGANLQIRYGMHPTPFGTALLATTERGICNLHFLDAVDYPTLEQGIEQTLRLIWAKADLIHDQDAIEAMGDRLFNTVLVRSEQPLPLLVKGTNFQVQVWRALLSVPPGGLATYQSIAHQIGRPTAARAVGNAIGRNPIAYLIPCHRVIRESGALGGYRWGLDRKTAMLGWEASHQALQAEKQLN